MRERKVKDMQTHKNNGKAGCENPATSSTSKTFGNRQRKIGSAAAGSFSRKIEASAKAGQAELANANQVKITKPSLGPVKGWSRLATPALPPRSPANSMDADKSSSYAKQSVKGKHRSAPAESAQAAGRRV